VDKVLEYPMIKSKANLINLRIDNLRYHQSDYSISDINIDIDEGASVGIVGESGSGKSTIGKILGAIINKSELDTFQLGNFNATLFFEHPHLKNVDILSTSSKNIRSYHKNVQYIFQNHRAALNLTESVHTTLKDALFIGYGNKNRTFIFEKLKTLASEIGLIPRYFGNENNFFTENPIFRKKNGQLSGGQMKRVSILKTFCINPSVVIADEPLTGLDASKKGQILQFFRNAQRNGRDGSKNLTLIMISHDLTMIKNNCEKIYVMYGDEGKRSGMLVKQSYSPQNLDLNSNIHHDDYTKKMLEASAYFIGGY
jgi:peptide/nickel transport system ATP-binding protein